MRDYTTEDNWRERERERDRIEHAAKDESSELIETAIDLLYEAFGDLYGRQMVRDTLTNYLHRNAAPPSVPTGFQKQRIPHPLRRDVFERDGYRCQRCGDWHNLAVDHIIPESKGGPTTLDNLQCLCKPCNSKKGARA